MADGTTIEWTEATWNPVRGCSRVSDGCRHCYAEGVAARFSGEGMPYEGLARFTRGGPQWTGSIRLVHELLNQPLRWRKPRRIFVNSMSDLFHADVPAGFIRDVFGVMAGCPQHTFQILTKRADRMREVLSSMDWREVGIEASVESGFIFVDRQGRALDDEQVPPPYAKTRPWRWPLPNVWLGVSVEDQRAAYDRIPHLIETPAVVRFLSCEPLLGPVDLDPFWLRCLGAAACDTRRPDKGATCCAPPCPPRIGWVIAGGESGPRARPCDVAWVRSLVGQCRDAGVPAFVKQLGCVWAREQPSYPMNDAKGSDPQEWPAELRVREMPEVTR